ncbi:beta strand repeat-containing protein [Methanobacterium veterum]|uniref:DUF11 domain-containing protein n=2 Tax=Methanobacterium TaxID=2160 RepID=A0A9E5A329_9EURY|nr:hypothetical protein [Methanobacterium veterum]MCZ3367058.1 hypothetical protein [Methanobacterium veterum]MCZ3373795.1 hypothetical protein [Methanobacterium veterum]
MKKQTITKKDNFKSITGHNKAKVMVPLLLLSLVLVFSFAVSDVAAAQGTSNNTAVTSNNLTGVNSSLEDSNTAVQSTSDITTSNSNKSSNSSNSNNLSNSSNSGINQTSKDPQIYNGGVPVARGGNPPGYVYPTIAAAITDAQSGDTIMLEDGATFQEHGLVVNKNLNFDVFNNGHATIDGQNLGTVFIIGNGTTVNMQNLIIINGNGTNGGAIYNNGTLTVNNSTFANNTATQNGGAIYNDGTLNYVSTTRTSETVTNNGGNLTVNNSTFTNNSAQNGGAIYNAGTINIATSTTLTDYTITQNGGVLNVNNSTFLNNTATQNGGAIANDATFNVVGFSTLTRTVVTQNGGTATISGSTFIGNRANNGGAISNLATLNTSQSTLTGTATTGTTALNSGTVTVTNSVIIGNTATQNGGAIYNGARTSVSASTFTDYTINNDATITARFNTMAGNSALAGGAVYNDATSTVTTSTLTRTTLNNDATATTTDNALVGNNATTGRDIVNNVVTTQNGNVMTVSFINNTGTVDAMRNWWGVGTGPSPGDVVGTVDTSNFLNYTMGITITASNSAPNVGQPFTYTITVTNNGPDTATDVQVADGIPAGLTFNGYTATQGTYNSGTEIWNVGTLASGASAVLQLSVTPTASLAGMNVTKNVTLINTNQTTNVTVSVPAAVSNVTITKTASNSSPNVGQPFSYTITVNNSGAASAPGVQVTDVIPAGLTFNSYTTSQGTYNSATGIWTVGTLASGASAVLQLFVTPTAAASGTTIVNNATIPGQIASATVVVPTTPVSNVTITKTASNLAPNVGQQFSYTITATNSGAASASGVQVTDVIPAGLTFNSYTASQGTYNSATGIWTVGTLASGASAVLQLFVTPTASASGTTIVNSATIPGQIASATVVVPTTPVSNVTITKTASNLAPNVGQQFSYTITATNSGAASASGVQVTDVIPAGLTFNGYTASQGTYNSATGIWTVGTLASGTSAVLQLFVTPTASVAGTTVNNAATIPGQIVNAPVVVPVTPVSNVTITKTASNLTPNVGQQFSYTITVNNSGAASASGVQVTDVIPAGLTFNSYTASQGTYNSATGIWTVGTLASGASAVLQLFVTPTAAAAGTTIVNTATSPGQIVNAPVVVSTTPVSNVTITKTASNSSPNVGQQFNYTITVKNNGSGTANNVQVTDVIPAGLTFNSYTASQGTYNSATGIWTVGTLASGASATLQLFVTPTASVAGKNIVNTATIPGQNASVTVHVRPNKVVVIHITKVIISKVVNVHAASIYNRNHGISSNSINNNQKLPMQPTGVPIMPLLLSVLLVITGFANNTRKKLK